MRYGKSAILIVYLGYYSATYALDPQLYLQTDPIWKDEVLGNDDYKMGKLGCAINSVAMQLYYYGINIDPKILNQKLNQVYPGSGQIGYVDGFLKWLRFNS